MTCAGVVFGATAARSSEEVGRFVAIVEKRAAAAEKRRGAAKFWTLTESLIGDVHGDAKRTFAEVVEDWVT